MPDWLIAMLSEPWAVSETGRLQIDSVLARAMQQAMTADHAEQAQQQAMLVADPAPVNPTVMLGSVAVINITGVLVRTPTWRRFFGLPDQATLGEITAAVAAAQADESVSATLLHIDSPGGSVASTPELAAAIYAHRADKPIWAHSASCMCSAAFWAGSQADRVYVGPACDAVNLGIYGTLYDASKMYADMGVKVFVARSGKFKGLGTFGEPLSDEMKAEMTRVVNVKRELFIDDVAMGRGIPRAKVEAVADGQVLVGQESVDAGMTDGVKSFQDTLALLSAGVGGAAA